MIIIHITKEKVFELLSNFLNQAPVVEKVDSANQWINF